MKPEYLNICWLLTSNLSGLQKLLRSVVDHSRFMELRLNVKQSKSLVISRTSNYIQDTFKVRNDLFGKNIIILGWVSDSYKLAYEIKCRIEQARLFMIIKKNYTQTSETPSSNLAVLIYKILFHIVKARSRALCKKLWSF